VTEQAVPALDAEGTRLKVAVPEQRQDRQGDMSDEERTRRALRSFVRDMYADVGMWLESCVHCGQCAEACHFYVQTGDPRYTPIYKLELFRKTYRREIGPFRWVYRALGKAADVGDLDEWQDLIYDSCTVCGRCSMICPMGIDIASMVSVARHGMAAAGLVPHELWGATQRAEATGSPLGATAEVFEERIEWMSDEHEVEIPLDKEKADVLVAISSVEIMKYPKAMADMAKVLNHLGVSWTFRSDGYEATNFGLFSGALDLQRQFSMKLVDTAIAIGAKTLILPECGHAYTALRWQGANFYGKPLPFEVMHMVEFLARALREDRLKLKPLGKSVTFHDPCQVVRRGGAIEEPREVLKALGADLQEMAEHGEVNWCCGGGGGVISMHRPDPIRYRAFKIKMEQVERSGAEMLVTTCANCRLTFDDGQAHYHWDKTAHSLLELVADNIAEAP
jgi:Fe-S oxidoreductase